MTPQDPEGAGPTGRLSGPLRRVLDRLPDVQRRVIELRTGLVDGHPRNLADTARSLNLTVAETRRIERRAFARIREVVPVDQLRKYLPD